MSATGKRPNLHVEGEDDKHSLIQLLERHGVSFDVVKIRDAPIKPPILIGPKERGGGEGVEALIKAIVTAIKGAANQTIGFVLDADASIVNRWRQVHRRLTEAGVDAPADGPPADGFIGESTRFKTRVGVWLMPDNERDGKLEDFLRTLINEGDPLILHVQESTDRARGLGATFSDADGIKAIIHCWLAWQDEPGKPYGQAMAAHYFQHNSPVADRFVAWFKRLYGLEG